MSEVEDEMDFIQLLGHDMSMKILSHLDDSCDLVRVSTVSRFWHRFVIENGFCKQLCLKMFPEISGAARTIEVDNIIEPVDNMYGSHDNWEFLKRNHKVYAFLASGLAPMTKNCISKAIGASSTDHYPEESIMNTLTEHRTSYWSSKGQRDPFAPETLVYKLITKACLVMEIHIQPFQAYFQYGHPIYSSKAVRFHMGHMGYPMDLGSDVVMKNGVKMLVDKQFSSTYTSPVFPMFQENRLQKFKLPKPVLCIGGVLVVELLGRVQTQEMDQLFYICISQVQVVGRPLKPPFDVQINEKSGECTLNYKSSSSSSSPRRDESNPSHLLTSTFVPRGARRWGQYVLGALLGSGSAVNND